MIVGHVFQQSSLCSIPTRIVSTPFLHLRSFIAIFSLRSDLQPRSNKPTMYMIFCHLWGRFSLNATAWAYTVDGQHYPACTTIQYGFKPSNNMTTLTVEPQATHRRHQQKHQNVLKTCAITYLKPQRWV